jgi:hypothetical protein
MKTKTTRAARIPVLEPGDELHTLGAQYIATYTRLVELNAQCDALPDPQSYDFSVAMSPVETFFDQLDHQLCHAMSRRGLPLAIVDGWLLTDSTEPGLPDRPTYVYPFKLGG